MILYMMEIKAIKHNKNTDRLTKNNVQSVNFPVSESRSILMATVTFPAKISLLPLPVQILYVRL